MPDREPARKVSMSGPEKAMGVLTIGGLAVFVGGIGSGLYDLRTETRVLREEIGKTHVLPPQEQINFANYVVDLDRRLVENQRALGVEAQPTDTSVAVQILAKKQEYWDVYNKLRDERDKTDAIETKFYIGLAGLTAFVSGAFATLISSTLRRAKELNQIVRRT